MNKRQSSYILPVTLIFVGVCVWFFWGQEQQLQQQESQQSFEKEQDNLETLKKQIIEAEKTKEEYKEEGKKEVQIKVPNGMRQGDLILLIENILNRAAFQTTSVSFSSIEEVNSKHGEILINFSATGNKSGLKRANSLLALFEQSERFFKIKELDYSLESEDQTTPSGQATLNLEILTYFDPNYQEPLSDESSEN